MPFSITPRGWALALLCATTTFVPLQLHAQAEADATVDMDLMQNIEDANKSLASNIALKDAKGSVSDAQELARMFVTVETYFAHKGDALDAVAISKKSRELATTIVDQIGRKDFDGATNNATALGRACRECHTFYKKS